MRKLFFVLILLASQISSGQEVSLQFEQANHFYRDGQYQKAAQMFEKIISNGYESPELYFNLGNAYFKIQNIPASILNFERAKRLAPKDEDVLYNLRLANLRVIDKIEPVPRLFFVNWWNSFVDQFSANDWALIGILSLWCAAITYALFCLVRKIVFKRIVFIASALILIFGILAFLCMYERLDIEIYKTGGIVVSQSVTIKSAPDIQSTDLFVLHEGVKIEFLDSVGNWRKIRLADGKIGWIAVENVVVI